MNFTYDEIKHQLTIEDEGEVRRYILRDNMGEIFRSILKAIDDLDSGWTSPDSPEKIPEDKLPDTVIQIDENTGVIEGGLDAVLTDNDVIHIYGGEP